MSMKDDNKECINSREGIFMLEDEKALPNQHFDTKAQLVAGGYQGLIPGLPDDLAYQCLLRVPWVYHDKLRAVCLQWKILLQSRQYHDDRFTNQLAQRWICALVRDYKQSNVWSAFDPLSKKWFPLPPMPNNLQSKAVGLECRVVCGKLVVCGGWCTKPLNDVTIFDPRTNKWTFASPMLSPRAHFVSGVIRDCLFVGGGGDGKQPRSQTAECYDPLGNKWCPLPDMEKGVSFCLGVTLDDNLFVQARGGEPKETQIYSPEFNLWSSLNTKMLSKPIVPHAVLDGLLYNARIYEGHFEINSYNSETDSWTELHIGGPIHKDSGRIDCVVAFDGKLWAIKDDFEVVLAEVDRLTMTVCLSSAPTGVSKIPSQGILMNCLVLWA